MNYEVLIIGSGNHHNTLGVICAIGRSGLGVDLITIDGSSKTMLLKVDMSLLTI